MTYDIYIYKLIIQPKLKGKKVINKKYFLKVLKIDNIPGNDITNKMIELKKLYNELYYVITFVKSGCNDYIIDNKKVINKLEV